MAILKRDPSEKPKIDLAGSSGNAFALLGLAGDLGKKLSLDKQEIEKIQTEMKSGDYDNLIRVFDEKFGAYVDLILPASIEESSAVSTPKSATKRPR